MIVESSKKRETLELIRNTKINNPELGTITAVKHCINLKVDKVICLKPFPIPISMINNIQDELEKLLKLGVIRKSLSPFSAPAFPILKKNGKIRIVIDYRKLNENTIPINFPIPKINDYLQELGGSTIFSQIDLNMGYYQIMMNQKDIEKTAFTLGKGHYEFLRMPFGLYNAPRSFQFAMMQIFSSHPFVKIYLDDLLIHSKNEEEHCQHINAVLEKLREMGASINFDKSEFFKEKVIYLGHEITAEGLLPDISRVDKFNNFIPKTKRQLLNYWGLLIGSDLTLRI